MFVRKQLQLLITLLGALVISSCGGSDEATVSCSNMAKLTTELGVLNTKGEVLGNLIELDPVTKQTAYVGMVTLNPVTDALITPISDKANITSDAGLSVSFNARLTKSEKAELTTELTQNMQLQLKNTNRHQITEPYDVVNRQDNAARIKKLLTRGKYLVLVDAGNTSEQATFGLKNGASSAVTLSAGGKSFSFAVTYQCQGDLTSQVSADRARQALAFFKVAEIVKRPDGTLGVIPFPGTLTDYDLSDATPSP